MGKENWDEGINARNYLVDNVKRFSLEEFQKMIYSIENLKEDIIGYKKRFKKDFQKEDYLEAASDLQHAHDRMCELLFNNKFPAIPYRELSNL